MSDETRINSFLNSYPEYTRDQVIAAFEYLRSTTERTNTGFKPEVIIAAIENPKPPLVKVPTTTQRSAEDSKNPVVQARRIQDSQPRLPQKIQDIVYIIQAYRTANQIPDIVAVKDETIKKLIISKFAIRNGGAPKPTKKPKTTAPKTTATKKPKTTAAKKAKTTATKKPKTTITKK